MTYVSHHVRKDLRHSRWLVAITWLAAAGILWPAVTPVAERVRLMEWLPFLRYGSWLLLFLTVGRIVQLDAPLRDTAFLRSRPVSQGTWIASKLVSCAILILPMALFQVLMFPLAGIQSETGDLVLIFTEEMLVHGVVAVFSLALAARMETYARFLTIAMGLSFACLVVFTIYVNAAEYFTRETKPEWSYDIEYLKLSRQLVTQIIAVAGLLIGLFITFRARRPERLTAAIAGTTLAASLAWFFWPVNFVKTFTRPEAEAPRSEWPDLSKVEFSFREDRFNGNKNARFNWGFGGYNDIHYQHISAYSRMEGLPPEWWVYPNGYRSSLVSPAGVVIESRQTAWAGLAEEIVLPVVGIPLPWKWENPAPQVEIGEFQKTKVDAAGPNAVLEGEVEIPIKRPVVLARIPLKAGASARIGNRRITVTSVEITRNDWVSYQTIEERPISKLRGGWHGEPHRTLKKIAINSRRGEFLNQVGESNSNHTAAHYALGSAVTNASVSMESSRGDTQVSSDWLDDAELIITGDESGGTFRREFRFENVNLIDTSWRP